LTTVDTIGELGIIGCIVSVLCTMLFPAYDLYFDLLFKVSITAVGINILYRILNPY